MSSSHSPVKTTTGHHDCSEDAVISVAYGNWDPEKAEAVTHSLFDRDPPVTRHCRHHARMRNFTRQGDFSAALDESLHPRGPGQLPRPSFYAGFRTHLRNISEFLGTAGLILETFMPGLGSTPPGYGHLPGS
jgi:hypothetical protein